MIRFTKEVQYFCPKKEEEAIQFKEELIEYCKDEKNRKEVLEILKNDLVYPKPSNKKYNGKLKLSESIDSVINFENSNKIKEILKKGKGLIILRHVGIESDYPSISDFLFDFLKDA